MVAIAVGVAVAVGVGVAVAVEVTVGVTVGVGVTVAVAVGVGVAVAVGVTVTVGVTVAVAEFWPMNTTDLALSDEHLALLRGLPKTRERVPTPEEQAVVEMFLGSPRQTIEILLATIDSEIERVLEAIVGNLENAATDCDGHTPYSILMALAEEIRAEHSANPQESDLDA